MQLLLMGLWELILAPSAIIFYESGLEGHAREDGGNSLMVESPKSDSIISQKESQGTDILSETLH